LNKLGEVTHACNPSYSGGGDWEDHDLRLAWAKVSEILILTNKQGVVVLTCNSIGHEARRIMIQAGPNKNMRLYLKNN
jgi:hypothetical protein